jgi:hypothetical protein
MTTFQATLKKPRTFGRLVAVLFLDIVSMNITAEGFQLSLSTIVMFLRLSLFCQLRLLLLAFNEYLHNVSRMIKSDDIDGRRVHKNKHLPKQQRHSTQYNE